MSVAGQAPVEQVTARNVEISSLAKVGETVGEGIVHFLDQLDISLKFYNLT